MTRYLNIYFIDKIEPIVLWSVIGCLAIVLIIMCLLLFRKQQKKVKKVTKTVSGAYVLDLCNALGGKENIKDITLEHKRLKVQLIQIKKVNQETLKTLDISAFLVGTELKLLIKEEAAKVFELLKKEVEKK